MSEGQDAAEDCGEPTREEMRAEIAELAPGVLESMHLTAKVNHIAPYVLLCSYMHAVAMFACLHATNEAGDGIVSCTTKYFEQALEHASLKLAEAQARKATKQ